MEQNELKKLLLRYQLDDLDWLIPAREEKRDSRTVLVFYLAGHGRYGNNYLWGRKRFRLPLNMSLTTYARHGGMTDSMKTYHAFRDGHVEPGRYMRKFVGGKKVPNYVITPRHNLFFLPPKASWPPTALSLKLIVRMIQLKFHYDAAHIEWGACCRDESKTSVNRNVISEREKTRILKKGDEDYVA